MRKMPWVKLSAGFLRDEKIHFIIKKYGHDTMVVWTGLLTECNRGVLEMDEEIFAEVCIMDMQRFDEIKKIFVKFGLVTHCNGEKLQIKNWEKYQFSESYERVKAHRVKQVTGCNEDETEKKQNVTVEVDIEVDKDLNTCASKPDALADFSEFWLAYPRKKNKGHAEKAWKKLKLNEQLHDRILNALGQAKTSDDWKKDGGKYIPYPATWLNAKGWEDEATGESPWAGAL